MRTAKLFPQYAAEIAAGGISWIRSNRAELLATATAAGYRPAAESALLIDLAEQSPAVASPAVASISVVIPCHNYARYLAACLESVNASTVRPERVIVIDDASDDDPEPIARRFGVEFVRVGFRDVHRVRRFGLELIRTKFVLFLDADNCIQPAYLKHCIERLEADREAAFAFPVLQGFGGSSQIMHGTDAAPQLVTAADIERRNWCDANSVHRAEVLRQSRALAAEVSTRCVAQDWRLARSVLRSGNWHALRSGVPLLYRVHPSQMTASPPRDYYTDADLEHETVAFVVAFSGRWKCWSKLRDWLASQTWPKNQTRLILLNSSHQLVTASRLGLEEIGFQSITIERIDAGRARLADEDRRTAEAIRQDVEAAVAGIYNRATQLAAGVEYLFFVEDDVIPKRRDAVEQLLQLMDADTVAASGLYRHRYDPVAVAFDLPTGGRIPMRPIDGPPVEQVGGTGFGCLLIRRSVLSRFGLSGDDTRRPHYDVDLAARIAAANAGRWLLNRGVACEHLIGFG